MKIKTILSLAVAGMALMTSCSNIDENERFIKGDAITVGKKVLIEDFTGQRCVNCPKATEMIAKLHDTFGDNIVAVGIYGGPFGKSTTGKFYPLTTETGEYYNVKNNVTEQPYGAFNRQYYLADYQQWENIVAELISMQTVINMECENTYDEASRQLTINVKAKGLDNVEGAYLQVWLTEDNIVNTQYMPDGKPNKDYVHNHVFRTSVNDRDGEPITITKDGTTEKTYTTKLDSEWKAEDMDVVAFVFTKDGVQQVVKTRVVK